MTTTTTTTTAAKKTYPFWVGGVAASWAAVCTHPMDVAKVRMQTGKAKGVINTLTLSVKASGFKQGLYAGLSASILRQMTYSLTRFGVYDALKESITVPGRPLEAWKMAGCASIAGGLGGVAGNPADIILVRMIADSVKPEKERLGYKNCFDGVYRIVREEGVSSLFRGLGPNVSRAVLMNASQLATYDVFKQALLKLNVMEDNLPLHFTSSFLAGTVATTICAPFDVVKSRIMNASAKEGTLEVISKAFRTEGTRWLFKGWMPAWIRLSPNTIIIFITLEQMKRFIDFTRRSS